MEAQSSLPMWFLRRPHLTSIRLCKRLPYSLIFTLGFFACSKQLSSGRGVSADGYEATASTLHWLENSYGFQTSAGRDTYLQKIIASLAPNQGKALSLCNTRLGLKMQAAHELSSLESAKSWQVFILQDSQPNAFSLGSQTIIISSALIERLSSEDELAAVLAHEMAHESLGHDQTLPSPSASLPVHFLAPELENEADQLGLCLLASSERPPEAAATALTKGYRREAASVSHNQMLIERILAIDSYLPLLPNACRERWSCPNSRESRRNFRRFQSGAK